MRITINMQTDKIYKLIVQNQTHESYRLLKTSTGEYVLQYVLTQSWVDEYGIVQQSETVKNLPTVTDGNK